MSVIVRKLYFDIYNLENDLKNKEQTILEYQALFEEYILNYKEQNSAFATTYNEIDELNKKIVQKEFDKTIDNIEQTLKNSAMADINGNYDQTTDADGESASVDGNDNSNKHLESVVKNYRDIVKLTHPDKTGHLDEETQKKYGDYYKTATDFYEKNELYGLMLINKMLGNNPFKTVFVDDDIENLRGRKDKLTGKIQEVQKTFIWNFMNIENEVELNTFISKHFKNMLNKMK